MIFIFIIAILFTILYYGSFFAAMSGYVGYYFLFFFTLHVTLCIHVHDSYQYHLHHTTILSYCPRDKTNKIKKKRGKNIKRQQQKERQQQKLRRIKEKTHETITHNNCTSPRLICYPLTLHTKHNRQKFPPFLPPLSTISTNFASSQAPHWKPVKFTTAIFRGCGAKALRGNAFPSSLKALLRH